MEGGINWLLVGLSAVYLIVAFTVLLPIYLVAGAVGLAAGLVGALAAGAVGIARGSAPRDVPPGEGVPADPVLGRPALEPAWAHYFARQGWSDLGHGGRTILEAGAATGGGLMALWDRYSGLDSLGPQVVLAPLLGVPGAAAVGVGLGGLAGTAAGGLALIGVGGVTWAGRRAAVTAVRAADRARVRRRGTGGTCVTPGCLAHTTVPIVECRACGRHHLDLRPGRYGVLRRRCACGTALPAGMSAAAAAGHVLRCPWCRAELGPGAMRDRDVRITVFGAAGAGVSSMIGYGLADLRQGWPGVGVEDLEAVPPPPGEPVPGCRSVRITVHGRTTGLHLVDTPAVDHGRPLARSRWYHLGATNGLAMVVDAAMLLRAAEGASAPDPPYHAVVSELRGRGVDPRGLGLAVLLHKADLLDATHPGRGPKPDSAGVARWLTEHGQYNLVTAAERDFGEVRWFVTERGGPAVRSPAGPVAWLARRAGVGLPGGTW